MRRLIFPSVLAACAWLGYGALAYRASPDKTGEATRDPARPRDVGQETLADSVRDGGVDPAFRITTPPESVQASRPLLSWTPVVGAIRYELTVARDPDCDDRLLTFPDLHATVARLERLPDVGPFYVCLWAETTAQGRVEAYDSGAYRLFFG